MKKILITQNFETSLIPNDMILDADLSTAI